MSILPVSQLSPAEDAADRLAIVESRIGWIAVQWRGNRVRRLFFDFETKSALLANVHETLRGEGQRENTVKMGSPMGDELMERLQAYGDGEAADFSDLELDLDHLTDFARRVVAACRAIPAGETRTYAELAELAGSPHAARAVGNVMSNNRLPIIVPCHRVVGSRGSLGGFSSRRGLQTKRQLLQAEAVLT